MELKPITVSFKNTPEERDLYKIIDKHSSKGAFIKDVLIEVLIKRQTPQIKKSEEIENCSTEIDEILGL